MDAHEHEPSYYEVALTNRQVVAGFVILLACLFAAFLSGVWLGKGGGAAAPGSALASIGKAPEAGEARLEQLTFFGQREAEPREAGARRAQQVPPAEPPPTAAAAPQRAAPTAAELEAERLRKTLEAEMAANRAAPAIEPSPAAAAPAGAAPGTRVRQPAEAAPVPSSPPAVAAAPAAVAAPVAATAPAASTWIQVFSSSDGANAQNLAGRLRRNGFKVVVLEAPGAGATTYRVRVGPYATRDEADRAASQLRRDHRLDTWVTDQS